MNEVKELLVATKALILDPKHWTQRSWARDKGGISTSEADKSAYCFCLSGALNRANIDMIKSGKSKGFPKVRAQALLNQGCRSKSCGENFILFNDTHPHAEVISLLDSVIKTLEEPTNENDQAGS